MLRKSLYDNITQGKDLKVWHKSIDFADKVIELLENLNSNRRHFRIMEQIKSASTSVSSNIACPVK